MEELVAKHSFVWNFSPLCLMCLLRKEQNHLTLEVQLKTYFIRFFTSESNSILEFIESLSFAYNSLSYLAYYYAHKVVFNFNPSYFSTTTTLNSKELSII